MYQAVTSAESKFLPVVRIIATDQCCVRPLSSTTLAFYAHYVDSRDSSDGMQFGNFAGHHIKTAIL